MAKPFDFPQLRAAADILECQAEVGAATNEGSVEKINRANSKLADAHYRYTEIASGRVPDRR